MDKGPCAFGLLPTDFAPPTTPLWRGFLLPPNFALDHVLVIPKAPCEGMAIRPNSRLMAIRQRDGKNHPTAQRLRLLRHAVFAENSSAFARRVGVSVQRMGNFENGFNLSQR